MLIILAVAAAIFLLFINFNTNTITNPSTIGEFSLFAAETSSSYTINSKGYSGKLDLHGPSGASVHCWSSKGYDFGKQTIPYNGMLPMVFYSSDTIKIEVTKTGYKPLTFNLQLPAASKPICWWWDTECQNSVPAINRVTVSLAPIQYTYSIQTVPEGCTIQLGAAVHTSPVTIPLNTGTYTFTISKTGYYSITKTITVPPSKTDTFTLTPLQETPDTKPDITPGTGRTLTVTTTPTLCDLSLSGPMNRVANSYINGYDFTALSEGAYTLTISKSGYNTKRYTLTIPGTSSIHVTLSESKYSVTINTVPLGCTVRLVGVGYDATENSGTTGAKFCNIPIQSYTCYVSSPGYTSRTDSIPAGYTSIRVYLQDTSADLTIYTQPYSLLQLSIRGTMEILRETSDGDGKAVFTNLPFADHQVVISKEGYYTSVFKVSLIESTNTYTFPLSSVAPKKLYVSANKKTASLTIEGAYSDTIGSDTWISINPGTYTYTATDECNHVITDTFTFPDTRLIYLTFPSCKKESDLYRLTIITNPSGCDVGLIDAEKKNTGTDGAAWLLLDKRTYIFSVTKEGYEEKTENIPINGEDKLVVINLEQSKDTIPPDVSLTGPTTAGRNELVTFTAKGDREMLYYQFDFGDGTISDWTRTYVISHYYKTIGDYIITVQGRNSKGLIGEKATTEITIDQEWKAFVPYITASDTAVGKITNVTISLPTNLDVDNYYLQTFVRSPKGKNLVSRWTVLDTNFTSGTITGTFEYLCNDTGTVTIGAQGIAMDPVNYKDTEEITITVDCLGAGTTSTGGGDTGKGTGGQGGGFIINQDTFLNNFYLSIGIIAALAIIVIITLIFLIVRTKKRSHIKLPRRYR